MKHISALYVHILALIVLARDEIDNGFGSVADVRILDLKTELSHLSRSRNSGPYLNPKP